MNAVLATGIVEVVLLSLISEPNVGDVVAVQPAFAVLAKCRV